MAVTLYRLGLQHNVEPVCDEGMSRTSGTVIG